MAENINPTQPLTPSLPVNTPPEDKRQKKEKQPQHDKNDDSNTDTNTNSEERPHHGLFDEYV